MIDRVYKTDLRPAGMCAPGAKKFFERHELDWRDFVRNGIEVEKLIALNDGMATKVIEVANGLRG
jgi:hypothetical protein